MQKGYNFSLSETIESTTGSNRSSPFELEANDQTYTPHFSQQFFDNRKREYLAINMNRRQKLFFQLADIDQMLPVILNKSKVSKGLEQNLESPDSFYAPTDESLDLICSAVILAGKARTHNELACDASKEIADLDILTIFYEDPGLIAQRAKYVDAMELHKQTFMRLLNEFKTLYLLISTITRRQILSAAQVEEARLKQSVRFVSVAERDATPSPVRKLSPTL